MIELSVVLVIIGLLVAGVVGASSLIEQSKLKMVMNEVRMIQSAVNSFKLTYKALPGDFATSTDIWSGAKTGDGDGLISNVADTSEVGASETGTVFGHLALADMIGGNFPVGNVLTTVPGMAFSSKMKGGAYLLMNYTMRLSSPVNRNNIASWAKNVIRLGKVDTNIAQVNTHVGYGLFTIDQAVHIDKKIDDGLARSGEVSGHNEYATGTNTAKGCLDFPSGTTSDATGAASYYIGQAFMCNMSFDLLLED